VYQHAYCGDHLKGTSRKRPVFQRLDQSFVEVYSMLPSRRTLEPPIGPPVAMLGLWREYAVQQNGVWGRAHAAWFTALLYLACLSCGWTAGGQLKQTPQLLPRYNQRKAYMLVEA
jgi:hypothetical protein